jgi:hypothetical protein
MRASIRPLATSKVPILFSVHIITDVLGFATRDWAGVVWALMRLPI